MQGRFRSGALATAALAACLLSANAAGAAAPKAPAGGEWLYVQTAKQATLVPAARGGALRLTLQGPAPTVQGFADRPSRKFEAETLANFIKGWKSFGFTRVPPNAAIVVKNGKANEDVLIVKLTRPKLSKNGALSYVARPLKGQPPADLATFGPRADKGLPAKLGPTSLFIDDADDRTATVFVGIIAPPNWTGTFAFSAPTLYSVNSAVATNVSSNGSVITASFPTGSPSNFNVPPNNFLLTANPVGGCVQMTVTESAPATITASAGPIREVHPGLNYLPTGNLSCIF